MIMKQVYWLRWYEGSAEPSVEYYAPINMSGSLVLGPYVVEFPLPDEAQREYDARHSVGRNVDISATDGTVRKATSVETST